MAGVIRSKLEFMGSRMFGAVHAVCRPQQPGSQTLMTFAGQGLAAPTEALAPVAPRGFMDAFRLLAVPKKKARPLPAALPPPLPRSSPSPPARNLWPGG